MRKLLRSLIALGLVAQAVVPGWMLLHRHLILTRGERVEFPVRFHDPRDLLMGHYVQLQANDFPPALQGVPKNYLRYYCDQRYAKAADAGTFGNPEATLVVRVWRGAALAEALRLEGLPAEVYMARAMTERPRPKPQREQWRYILFPEALPRVLYGGYDWIGALNPKAGNVTHVRLPVDRAAFARLLHLALNDGKSSPLPPREETAICDRMRQAKHALAAHNLTGVLPLFQGFGFPCDRPLDRQADIHYLALTRAFGLTPSDRIAFEGPASGPMVSPELLKPLFAHFPHARLLLHGNTMPEGIDPAKVVLLPAPDSPPPPKGAQWLASGEAPKPLPEECLGTYAPQSLLPHLSPDGDTPPEQLLARLGKETAPPTGKFRATIVATFATRALACYAKTRNPEARRLADALLDYAPNHSLWRVYQQCDTYQDYVEYVRWVAKHFPDPMLVPLARWPTALRNLETPPPPIQWNSPDPRDLRSLARKVMALPTE